MEDIICWTFGKDFIKACTRESAATPGPRIQHMASTPLIAFSDFHSGRFIRESTILSLGKSMIAMPLPGFVGPRTISGLTTLPFSSISDSPLISCLYNGPFGTPSSTAFLGSKTPRCGYPRTMYEMAGWEKFFGGIGRSVRRAAGQGSLTRTFWFGGTLAVGGNLNGMRLRVSGSRINI